MSDFIAVVIGKSGQVGRSLGNELLLQGFDVHTTSSKKEHECTHLDLSSSDSIDAAFEDLISRIGKKTTHVFLAGAMTHVDQCEEKVEICRRINSSGPIQVAQKCRELGWSLSFFSSEYVFGGAEYRGGQKGPFSETDVPEPTCEYGKSKLEAERGILDALPSAQILRTTMVFSWEPKGMNFLMQYLRHMEAAKNGGGRKFRIPKDQISTPTYGPALSRAAIELARMKERGIFNLVGPDLLSRKELVERVADYFGYSRDLVAESFEFVNTSQLGQVAKRPLTAGLTMRKANAKGITIPSLNQAFSLILPEKESSDLKENF